MVKIGKFIYVLMFLIEYEYDMFNFVIEMKNNLRLKLLILFSEKYYKN